MTFRKDIRQTVEGVTRSEQFPLNIVASWNNFGPRNALKPSEPKLGLYFGGVGDGHQRMMECSLASP